MVKSSREKILLVVFAVLAVAALAFAGIRLADTVFADSGASYPEAELVIYDGPNLLRGALDVEMKVNGNELYVYNTAVNNSHSWVEGGDPPIAYTPMTYFDFEGAVLVELTLTDVEALSDVIVRPLATGIEPYVSGNKISFYLTEPGQYTVEYNGSIERAVHIFANPLETYVPDPSDPNVFIIEPGFWNIDSIALEDNQTLYISGGAVVYGTVRANGAKNVTIRGRGIMDGSLYQSWTHDGVGARHPVDFIHCDGIYMEGVIFANSNAWVVNSLSSKNAHFDNIKVISARQNGDGITLQSCENFLVTNSFVRSWDDSLVVKNYEGSSNNITFDNIQIWTDLAQSMEIGYETNKGGWAYAMISNITFKNITVLHNFHKPVISIHNGDDAVVTDIVWDNIVVEDASMGQGDGGANNQLIDFTIAYSGNWSKTNERGHIRNVTISNVSVLGGKETPWRIIGYSPSNTVENVTISNVNVLGKQITSFDDIEFQTNEFTANINITG